MAVAGVWIYPQCLARGLNHSGGILIQEEER